MSNKPILKLRDGLITASVWKNQTKEEKNHYSVTVTRSYLSEEQWFESTSFSGAELFKAARLMQQAYDEIQRLRAADKAKELVPA